VHQVGFIYKSEIWFIDNQTGVEYKGQQ